MLSESRQRRFFLNVPARSSLAKRRTQGLASRSGFDVWRCAKGESSSIQASILKRAVESVLFIVSWFQRLHENKTQLSTLLTSRFMRLAFTNVAARRFYQGGRRLRADGRCRYADQHVGSRIHSAELEAGPGFRHHNYAGKSPAAYLCSWRAGSMGCGRITGSCK